MTVVKSRTSLLNMTQCWKTISGENHDIIVSEEGCTREKTPFQDEMTPDFFLDRLPEWDDLPCEPELSRIETSWREKSRDQISTECIRHERHKSFASSLIEESIVDDGDFFL